MNSAQLQKMIALALIASGVVLIAIKAFSIDDAYLGAQSFMSPADGTTLFALLLVIEFVLLVARFGLGYMLYTERTNSGWLVGVSSILVFVSGFSGAVLVAALIVLFYRKSRREASET